MRCTSFGLQVSFVNMLKFPLIPLSFKTFSYRVNSLTIDTSTRSFFLRLLHRVFKERHDSRSTQQRHYCLHQTAHPREKQCRCVTLKTNFDLQQSSWRMHKERVLRCLLRQEKLGWCVISGVQVTLTIAFHTSYYSARKATGNLSLNIVSSWQWR